MSSFRGRKYITLLLTPHNEDGKLHLYAVHYATKENFTTIASATVSAEKGRSEVAHAQALEQLLNKLFSKGLRLSGILENTLIMDTGNNEVPCFSPAG